MPVIRAAVAPSSVNTKLHHTEIGFSAGNVSLDWIRTPARMPSGVAVFECAFPVQRMTLPKKEKQLKYNSQPL